MMTEIEMADRYCVPAKDKRITIDLFYVYLLQFNSNMGTMNCLFPTMYNK